MCSFSGKTETPKALGSQQIGAGHGCGVPTETTPLDPGGTPRSWIEAEEEDEEVSRIARLVVLALFTVLTISVTSVTASLLLVTSQIMHVAQSPRWTFYAITGTLFILKESGEFRAQVYCGVASWAVRMAASSTQFPSS